MYPASYRIDTVIKRQSDRIDNRIECDDNKSRQEHKHYHRKNFITYRFSDLVLFIDCFIHSGISPFQTKTRKSHNQNRRCSLYLFAISLAMTMNRIETALLNSPAAVPSE